MPWKSLSNDASRASGCSGCFGSCTHHVELGMETAPPKVTVLVLDRALISGARDFTIGRAERYCSSRKDCTSLVLQRRGTPRSRNVLSFGGFFSASGTLRALSSHPSAALTLIPPPWCASATAGLVLFRGAHGVVLEGVGGSAKARGSVAFAVDGGIGGAVAIGGASFFEKAGTRVCQQGNTRDAPLFHTFRWAWCC